MLWLPTGLHCSRIPPPKGGFRDSVLSPAASHESQTIQRGAEDQEGAGLGNWRRGIAKGDVVDLEPIVGGAEDHLVIKHRAEVEFYIPIGRRGLLIAVSDEPRQAGNVGAGIGRDLVVILEESDLVVAVHGSPVETEITLGFGENQIYCAG